LRDRPCALSPHQTTSNPGEAGPLVAAGSALLERLPPDVPPAARDRLAAALIPPSGVRRRRLGHRPAQLPRDPASEVLAWMAHALIAATRLGDTPDNASRDEPPPPAQHRNPRPPGGTQHAAALPLRLPEPLIPAARGAKPGPPPVDPSRDMRGTADVALKDVTGRTSHRQPVQTGT
jgi:hypothetical protein